MLTATVLNRPLAGEICSSRFIFGDMSFRVFVLRLLTVS